MRHFVVMGWQLWTDVGQMCCVLLQKMLTLHCCWPGTCSSWLLPGRAETAGPADVQSGFSAGTQQ